MLLRTSAKTGGLILPQFSVGMKAHFGRTKVRGFHISGRWLWSRV